MSLAITLPALTDVTLPALTDVALPTGDRRVLRGGSPDAAAPLPGSTPAAQAVRCPRSGPQQQAAPDLRRRPPPGALTVLGFRTIVTATGALTVLGLRTIVTATGALTVVG